MLEEYKTILQEIEGLHRSQAMAVQEINDLTDTSNKTLTTSNKTMLDSLKNEKQYALVLGKVSKGVKLNGKEQKVLQQYLNKAKQIVQ
jgi:hypothetical protein